ncbi:anti-phage deoxyguanosine triphosphatase [uncultured Paraglaciecola sp.]|uniref:anti-phage deoxyguanosine triphosphatase n=1 Tax=uncultured Paraglaciecola sp. TaxID=1765024 RepID=UPI002632BA80|nr:anti-phage deoxyguanosine triphosphatase [uncultured Paraglaciecola sp.]
MDLWTQRKHSQKLLRQGDHRTPYQRDKARILHSAAFRRLQAKTQVLGAGMSDFYRTRLTHSLEASQIGQGIAAQLRSKYAELTQHLDLNDNLIEALCLAHDIGHPPFGHGGEVALHYMMREHGGFEGNGQTFRIVTKLEPYTAEHGMNLSRRTLLGLIKYPNYLSQLNQQPQEQKPTSHREVKASLWHPPKGLYECDKASFDWLFEGFSTQDTQRFMKFTSTAKGHHKTLYKSFDCSIMELADDIAYGIHDLEDAIVMGIVNHSQFHQEVTEPLLTLNIDWMNQNITALSEKLFSQHHHERKDAIGALVNCFITNIEITQTAPEFEQDLLKYNAVFPAHFNQALSIFKAYVFNRVIRKPDIQMLEYKGQQIVMELFQAFASDPQRLLPDNTRQRWIEADEAGNGRRVIADYISGMTDGFASKLYGSLFMPSSSVVSEKMG